MLNKDLQIHCRNVQPKKEMKPAIAPYGQGLLQGWNSLLVQPGTAAD